MSDVGLIGQDAVIVVEIGQRADGGTPIYGPPINIIPLNRGRRADSDDTAEVTSTRGVGNGEDFIRLKFTRGQYQLDYVVTLAGRIFQGCIGCYCRVTFEVASALNNPDIREGIITNVKPQISDDATIESVTIQWNADHD